MNGSFKRVTFVITPELEEQMKALKQEVYFDKTQSEMIRDLVAAGIRFCKADRERVGAERKNA